MTSERTIIAERVYKVSDSNETLILRFYMPFKDESGRYTCQYELLERPQTAVVAKGLDAVDAIDTAFWLAGSQLAGLNESLFNGKLHWEGAQPNKPIGLPVIIDENTPVQDY